MKWSNKHLFLIDGIALFTHQNIKTSLPPQLMLTRHSLYIDIYKNVNICITKLSQTKHCTLQINTRNKRIKIASTMRFSTDPSLSSFPVTSSDFKPFGKERLIQPQLFHFRPRPPDLDCVIIRCSDQHLGVTRIKGNGIDNIGVRVFRQASPVVTIPKVTVFVFGPTGKKASITRVLHGRLLTLQRSYRKRREIWRNNRYLECKPCAPSALFQPVSVPLSLWRVCRSLALPAGDPEDSRWRSLAAKICCLHTGTCRKQSWEKTLIKRRYWQ